MRLHKQTLTTPLDVRHFVQLLGVSSKWGMNFVKGIYLLPQPRHTVEQYVFIDGIGTAVSRAPVPIKKQMS
jgi:hypothetical protein